MEICILARALMVFQRMTPSFESLIPLLTEGCSDHYPSNSPSRIGRSCTNMFPVRQFAQASFCSLFNVIWTYDYLCWRGSQQSWVEEYSSFSGKYGTILGATATIPKKGWISMMNLKFTRKMPWTHRSLSIDWDVYFDAWLQLHGVDWSLHAGSEVRPSHG